MAPGSAARSRASLVAAQAMPIIAEDDSVAPALPKRSASRRSTKPVTPAAIYNYNYYPFSSRSPAPTIPTTSSSDGTAPDRKSEHGGSHAVQHHEWAARRGGWYRILITALVIIVIIVGLAVGLTLRFRSKSSPPASTTAPDLFPAGNYTFTTALSSISTSCSSSPKTWRCYPYALYSPGSNASSATFFWTITPQTSWSYSVSSTQNPFAPSFTNLPMTLLDANQYTERFAFNFSQPHSSVVDGGAGALGVPGGATTTCWFNSTVTAVTLWTRIRAEFPPGIEAAPLPTNETAAAAAADAFPPWPFRVEVRQTQQGGAAGVPDCRDPSGENVGGDQLGAAGECGCFYSNFGLNGAGNGTGNATASASGTASVRGRLI